MQQTLGLSQKGKFGYSAELAVHGCKEIRACFRDGSRETDFTIPLDQIDPRPYSTKNSPVGWWIASAAFIGIYLAAMFAIFTGMAPDPYKQRFFVCGITTLFFGWLPILIVRAAVERTYDSTIFHYRNGGVAFAIPNNQPSKEAVAAFVAELSDRIKRAVPLTGPSAADGFAAQLLQLDELRQRGVLSDEEFAKAKARVLESGERIERRIGFAAA